MRQHVSAVLKRDEAAVWKALYLVCVGARGIRRAMRSQIGRAATLDAESQGPEVWISNGKHAAFLGPAIPAGADAISRPLRRHREAYRSAALSISGSGGRNVWRNVGGLAGLAAGRQDASKRLQRCAYGEAGSGCFE